MNRRARFILWLAMIYMAAISHMDGNKVIHRILR
jgi:hypothetical protein